MRVRQVLPYPASGLDESDAVAVVLLHSSGNGENIRVENNVLWREADLIDHNVVGAFADPRLALRRIGLALLVARAHHDRRPMAPQGARVLPKRRRALLRGAPIPRRLAL